MCLCVCHLANFVPSHTPAWWVAASVAAHSAHWPVGTAFIKHDRTSLFFSFPLLSSLLSLSVSHLIDPILLAFHPGHFYPSWSCFFTLLTPSLFPVMATAVPGFIGGRPVLPLADCTERWSQRRGGDIEWIRLELGSSWRWSTRGILKWRRVLKS